MPDTKLNPFFIPFHYYHSVSKKTFFLFSVSRNKLQRSYQEIIIVSTIKATDDDSHYFLK